MKRRDSKPEPRTPRKPSLPPLPVAVGRGHKPCPGCHEVVGARTKTCKCGHEFSPKIEGADSCKSAMLQFLRAMRGADLVEIAKARVKKTHPGCPHEECCRDNKQIQSLLTDLVKEGKTVKDGRKYKVVKR